MGPVNLDKVEAILKDAPEWERIDLGYFVGRFLLKHGKSENAEKYLKRATPLSEYPRWGRTLAAALLNERGIDFHESDYEEN